MPSITVYDSVKSKAIEDATIISGYVDGTGDLILVRKDGIEVNAGDVMGPQGDPGAAGGLDTPTMQSICPPGMVNAFAGTVAPTGWVFCNGASYLRSSLPSLFAVIGITYGAVDGTHFNVPDYRGRFLLGKAAAGARSAVNDQGGSNDAVSVAHSHSHAHTISTSGAHQHPVDGDSGLRYVASSGTAQPQMAVGAGAGSLNLMVTDTDSAGSHNHGGTSGVSAVSSGVAGTDANIPPFVVVNYIIRY